MVKKVAIIEDDPKNMKLFEAILSMLGDITILKEEHGERGLELIIEKRPDLIILDIRLPGRSGIEICRELRSRDTFKEVPIIAVTAYAMSRDKERIMDAGKTLHITQKELGEKLGMPQSMISRIENGITDPPYSNFKKIYDFLFKKYSEFLKKWGIIKTIEIK